MDMSSFEPQYSFEHLDKLSYEIGPRLAGTERSQLAAEYIKEQFENYGLRTRFQNFEFVDKVGQVKAIAMVLAGVFVIAPFLTLYLGPLYALSVVIGGYVFSHVLPRILPKKSDRNVVGILKPEGSTMRRIVVGAHYDSTRSVRGRKWSLYFRATFPIILAIFLALSIFGLFVETNVWLLFWLVLAPFYLFICIFPFWIHEDLVSPGANDNASGVSVMLESARVASESPPEETEIWFVAFGAEEQGLVGSKEFSKRISPPDFLLNLDSVGSGDRLVTIGGNGIFRRRWTSPELNDKMGREFNVGAVWAPLSGHDHIPAVKKGLKATTLSSIESRRKGKFDGFLENFLRLPNVRTHRHSKLHTLEDVPEGIKLENIKESGRIVLKLLGIEEK